MDKRALNKALKEEKKEVMALSFPAVTSNNSGLFLWRLQRFEDKRAEERRQISRFTC